MTMPSSLVGQAEIAFGLREDPRPRSPGTHQAGERGSAMGERVEVAT